MMTRLKLVLYFVFLSVSFAGLANAEPTNLALNNLEKEVSKVLPKEFCGDESPFFKCYDGLKKSSCERNMRGALRICLSRFKRKDNSFDIRLALKKTGKESLAQCLGTEFAHKVRLPFRQTPECKPQ